VSSGATVFRIEEDGLDSAAFLAGVRRVILGNVRLDSVVSAAVVRHIDYLLGAEGSSTGDPRIEERAKQIEASLRNVLALGEQAVSPNTAAFKRIIADDKDDKDDKPRRRKK
jgi:hypothetical protein